MANYRRIIILLLFLLALGSTQGQPDHALAREGAPNALAVEPNTPILHQPLRSSNRSSLTSLPLRLYAATRDKLFYVGSWTKKRGVQLADGIHGAVDYTSRTYRYLKAARKHARAVQKYEDTTGHTTCSQRIVDTTGSAFLQTPTGPLSIVPLSPPEQISEIAEWAGLRLEEVTTVALVLEGPMRQVGALALAVTELPVVFQRTWQSVLFGWWRSKLTIGSITIMRGCIWELGMGRCWPTVSYVVVSLLLAPVYLIVDRVIQILRG